MLPLQKVHIPKQGQSENAGGHLDTLSICKMSKVMISVNLCVKFGLYNGAIGIVEDIIHCNDRRPPSLPDVVIVEVPNNSGPPFIPEKPKVVPIFPEERKIYCRCHFCRRKQIPLRLWWATTFHRCQGMTIWVNRYIVIHPGTNAFESRNPGALFVAISRAKSTGKNDSDPDFAWRPSFLANAVRICHKVKTPTASREKEIHRIETIASQTYKTFKHLMQDINLRNLKNNLNSNISEE